MPFLILNFFLIISLLQHPDICEFPSQHFYGGKLVTPLSVIDRDRETRLRRRFINFWPSHSDADYVPLVFCNVVGEEEEFVVTTEEGNQRSKSNLKERDKVVRYYWGLCGESSWRGGGIRKSTISQLTFLPKSQFNPHFISVIHSPRYPNPIFPVPILSLNY